MQTQALVGGFFAAVLKPHFLQVALRVAFGVVFGVEDEQAAGGGVVQERRRVAIVVLRLEHLLGQHARPSRGVQL